MHVHSYWGILLLFNKPVLESRVVTGVKEKLSDCFEKQCVLEFNGDDTEFLEHDWLIWLLAALLSKRGGAASMDMPEICS